MKRSGGIETKNEGIAGKTAILMFLSRRVRNKSFFLHNNTIEWHFLVYDAYIETHKESIIHGKKSSVVFFVEEKAIFKRQSDSVAQFIDIVWRLLHFVLIYTELETKIP